MRVAAEVRRKTWHTLCQWKSHTRVVNECAGTLPAVWKLLLVWRSGSRIRGRVTEFGSLKLECLRMIWHVTAQNFLSAESLSFLWFEYFLQLNYFFVRAEVWCLGACHLICVVKFANTLCVRQVGLLTLFHWCLSQRDMPGESHDLV